MYYTLDKLYRQCYPIWTNLNWDKPIKPICLLGGLTLDTILSKDRFLLPVEIGLEGLSSFRNLVPILEPGPNIGTWSQFWNLVQILEPDPNSGN